MVQRQNQPGPPVLAQLRPGGHPLLRPPRAAGARRPRRPRGLHPRGHLVRILGRRRHPRRRRLLLLHRAGARRTPRPAAAGGRLDRIGTGSLAILPYETVRTAHQPRATLLAFCQGAYEAGALLAGWDTTAFTPPGAPPSTSSASSTPTPPPTSAAPQQPRPTTRTPPDIEAPARLSKRCPHPADTSPTTALVDDRTMWAWVSRPTLPTSTPKPGCRTSPSQAPHASLSAPGPAAWQASARPTAKPSGPAP